MSLFRNPKPPPSPHSLAQEFCFSYLEIDFTVEFTPWYFSTSDSPFNTKVQVKQTFFRLKKGKDFQYFFPSFFMHFSVASVSDSLWCYSPPEMKVIMCRVTHWNLFSRCLMLTFFKHILSFQNRRTSMCDNICLFNCYLPISK